MNDFQFGQWSQLRETEIGCELIAGNNVNGPVIASGPENRMLRYMSKYSLNQRQTIPDPGVAVQFLTADNSNSPIVANSGSVRYLPNYTADTWVPPRDSAFCNSRRYRRQVEWADNFSGPHLALLKSYSATRNNRTGVVAFGGSDSNQIAYLDRFVGGNWVVLPAPVQVG